MSYQKLRLAKAVGKGEYGTYLRHRRNNTQLSGIHCHDFYEIFWVEKGPGMHWINGDRRELPVGAVQLIRPEDNHGLYSLPDTEFQWTNVACFASTWTSLRRRYFSDRLRYFDLSDWRDREFLLSKDQLSELRLAAGELSRGDRSLLGFERFLLNALGLLPGIKKSRSNPPAWLSELDQELRQQANFSLGVSALVARAGRCPEHVCREFRRYFDCTPTTAMNESRMDYAARMLVETEIKIVDLALEIGLQNLGHFYRSFEQRFDCTPRQYRVRQLLGRKLPPISDSTDRRAAQKP